MSRKIVFIILVFTFTTISLFYGLKNEELIVLSSINNEPLKRERIIKKVKVKKIAFADTTAINQVFQPTGLKSDESSFYTVDFSTMLIHRFNINGELINTIGKGRGRGPGEMLIITDFYIDNEFVWVVDSNQLRISKFKKNGGYIESRTIKGHPLRVVSTSKNRLSVLTFGGEGLFRSIPKDLGSNEINSFGNIIENQARNVMSLDGWLQSLEKGGFIYIPQYASLLYYYNEDDSLVFIAKTPDGQKFMPSIDKSTSKRMQIMAPEPEITTNWSTIFRDKLYTVEYHEGVQNADGEFIKPSNLFVDVFMVDNGEYLYSFVPPSFLYFTIIEDTLITISRNEIHKYEINQS